MTWFFLGKGWGHSIEGYLNETLLWSTCIVYVHVFRSCKKTSYASIDDFKILGDFAIYNFDFFHCKSFLFRVHGIVAYLNNTLQDF